MMRRVMMSNKNKKENKINEFTKGNPINGGPHRRHDTSVACDLGAIGFMEALAESAGSDLVYSLALEAGNIFMCVTAFPSMTSKRFTSSEDGMRAIFLIDKNEYHMSQDSMVSQLTSLINDQIYYEDDLVPEGDLISELPPDLVKDAFMVASSDPLIVTGGDKGK